MICNLDFEMHQNTKEIQKRYEGFLQTPSLWKSDVVYQLNQFIIEPKSKKIDLQIDEKLRLGKYIECFVFHQLRQEKTIEVISENIQIQQDKRTLGELDCIILKDDKPIHLEIIYKFYLYDCTVRESEIEHFIGPNKKDSLIEKLNKLKEKQLPLLYSDECLEYLKSIKINVDKIKQQVYFKAQLFVPYQTEIKLKILNSDSIVGFYINSKQLDLFKNCKFYIPNKKDWLVKPHPFVHWLDYDSFKTKVVEILSRQFSPLCWLKKENGEIEKFFLICWNINEIKKQH